jgi:hypothetical protein
VQQPPPLSIASSLTILVMDWSSFAYIASHPQYLATATAVAALITLLLVHGWERSGDRSPIAPRRVRALAAAIAVAVPLPLYGSLIATAFLTWAGLGRRSSMR